ncbi:hypothetical protein GCM10010330_44910 [Streptomyces tendae]|uniref:hypothetical protein n=1 Tax=Streptomyces tendae TaxID=1932 RepID=UPI001674BB4B|nr:hypothetical protein [Streptomyces tendae]GHA85626.1 hypothetical protein GCM10010330_44910 [Streptomyces tendae]
MTTNTAEGHPLSTQAARRRFNKEMRTKGIPAKVCGRCRAVKGVDAFSKSGYCAPCNLSKSDRHPYEWLAERFAGTPLAEALSAAVSA